KEKLTPEQRANVEKALKILPPETRGKSIGLPSPRKRRPRLLGRKTQRTKSLKQRYLSARLWRLGRIPHRLPMDLRNGLRAMPHKSSVSTERTFSCSLSP